MTDLTHRTVQAGGLAMHVAEAGPKDGPLLILLHGFPEFWLEWREQIGPLASAGFHVVAPDQRGYNLTAKPKGVAAYRLDGLADDVCALADALGCGGAFQVVGHDWGASVAWWLATRRPERLRRMAVMNAPHPAVWRRAMTEDPVQKKKSQYVQFLRTPVAPELLVRARGYKGLEDALKGTTRPEAFGPEVIAQYHAAWRRPGALTATLNWYRGLFAQDLPVPPAGSLKPPTLVLWGDRDVFGEASLAEASAALCADVRVVHFPEAGHWLPHDAPEAVTARLLEFLER